jgi:D-threo-aldose 1-dehydrogenase
LGKSRHLFPEIGFAIGAVFASERHGVPLVAAALQFPFGHPLVDSVIPGGLTPEHVTRNVAAFRHRIPSASWAELEHGGLLRTDAPTP